MSVAIESSILVSMFHWAFTSADKKKFCLITRPFCSCYAVSYVYKKYAALAHVPDMTDVTSLSQIAQRFQQHSVQSKDVKVIVIGGWRQGSRCGDSYKWGQLIIAQLKKDGFSKIDTEKMNKKRPYRCFKELLEGHEEVGYKGLLVNAKTGETVVTPVFRKDSEQEAYADQKIATYEKTEQLAQLAEVSS